MKITRRFFALLLLFSAPAGAQSRAAAVSRPQISAEQRTSHALEIARANPLDLHAFLVDMPKGADLHSHLSGAIYAESWIRAAAADQLCVNTASLSFAKPSRASEEASGKTGCGDGKVPASQASRSST